jgi:hypothetical protein
MQPLQTAGLAGTVSPSLSMFDLFLQSDSIVKLVMLILLIASFWSWAVSFWSGLTTALSTTVAVTVSVCLSPELPVKLDRKSVV